MDSQAHRFAIDILHNARAARGNGRADHGRTR
jgi:hypothetical protein